MKRVNGSLGNVLMALIYNTFIVLCCYIVCRIAFTLENINLFPNLQLSHFLYMCLGGLRFDISAFCYTNILYIVLMLLPFHLKERKGYYKSLKWLFIVINSIALLSNLMDSVYFQFVNRRATVSVFTEFKNDANVIGIIGGEFVNHWYFTLLGIALVVMMTKLYRNPNPIEIYSKKRYYSWGIPVLLLSIILTFAGIRSDLTFDERPLNNRNAKAYAEHPIEAGIVLNTPFSIIRTIGKKPFVDPKYYPSYQASEKYFNSVHHNTMPDSICTKERLNLVFIILEGFGAENSAYLNPQLDGGKYKGYMPFIDSLMSNSLVFDYSFAHGRQSIDMAPSVFSSIPKFVESFFTSQAATNDISSIAAILDKQGYRTAFFHGADNGSLGFEDFARNAGFMEYYGRNEYVADKEFGGNNDYDGHWGIYDEPFLQFFCKSISGFKQPFFATVFTLSSHHPFHIPKKYAKVFPDGPLPINKLIGYTDNAVRNFFNEAKKQPWYKHTLFVLTGDHTSGTWHDEYNTDMGRFRVPLIFFKPGNDTFKGRSHSIAQQIDVMPTVLDYLGCKTPYVAFGCNLLSTPTEKTYAVNYNNGIYQYFKNGLMMQFDREKTIAVYRFEQDPLLKHNLIGKLPEEAVMEKELKAIIQQYMERMSNNELVVKY